MTSLSRKNHQTTLPAKSTRNRTACSLLCAAALLLAANSALGEAPGAKSSSTFVPRQDGPRAGLAAPILTVQAKAEPGKKVDLNIGAKPGQDPFDAYIRLEPPGRERLFGNRDTERELEERMRQERRDFGTGDAIAFPPAPQLSSEEYRPRQFSPGVCLVEPNYVVYRRLYFEEKNAERYGWNIGLMQPAISTLTFFKDVALLPQNFVSYPHRRFETNAGQCQPGDTVPYLWYPPEFTSSGLLAEVGMVYLLFAAIP